MTNNAELVKASTSRPAHTQHAARVTWEDVEAVLLSKTGADGLAALLNAPCRVETFLRARRNVVALSAVARRGMRTQG